MESKEGAGSRFDVDLMRVDRCALRGTVRNANGQPLEGVTVSDKEKNVQTSERMGRPPHAPVRQQGLPGHHYIPRLTYSKEGYVTQQFVKNEVGEEGLVVVLERQVPLEGQVLGPDGRPVKSFRVCAGPGGPSTEYVNLKRVERIVQDTAGRFKLWLDRDGQTWVCVRAEGYANWEFLTDVPRSGGSLVVRLETGVPITGRILVPHGGLVRLEARLVPRRDPSDGRGFGSGSEAVDWISRTTTVAADGTLRFDHVRPDRYTLLLRGPGVSSRLVVFDVPAGGLHLGGVRLAGRGRIQGRLFERGERGGAPRLFADGFVYSGPAVPEYLEKIEFMSDEDGRFSVGGVPVGRASVRFLERIPHSPSIETQEVVVCEDQTTEMRVFGLSGSRPLTVELRVGDGSKAQYRSGSGHSDKPEQANVTDLVLGAEAELEPTVRFRVKLVPRFGQPLSSVQSGVGRIRR